MAKETKTKAKVQSLDEYLGARGLSAPVTDYNLDKMRLPHSETARQRKAREKAAITAINDYSQRRNAAIDRYNAAVAKGDIRPPTVVEKALKTAHGHEDNAAVQAARRVLAKRGIDWRTGKSINEKDDNSRRKSVSKKYRYIAMVETKQGNRVEQWGEGVDGHSLSSSGRWTDKRLRSSKKNAEEVAEQLAAGFNKREKARPYVRLVVLDDEDLPSKPRREVQKKKTKTAAKSKKK